MSSHTTTARPSRARLFVALVIGASLAVAAPASAAQTTSLKAASMERVAKVGGKHAKRVKPTAAQRRTMQRSLAQRTGRSSGDYLGPYCVQYNGYSYDEYACTWQETFGMWITWTYTWKNYGYGWVGQGWSFY